MLKFKPEIGCWCPFNLCYLHSNNNSYNVTTMAPEALWINNNVDSWLDK